MIGFHHLSVINDHRYCTFILAIFDKFIKLVQFRPNFIYYIYLIEYKKMLMVGDDNGDANMNLFLKIVLFFGIADDSIRVYFSINYVFSLSNINGSPN